MGGRRGRGGWGGEWEEIPLFWDSTQHLKSLTPPSPPPSLSSPLPLLPPPGFSDRDVSETPLIYSLLVTRCSHGYCEDFCVYRGPSAEHASILPPGLRGGAYRVNVTVTVEDHQGAAVCPLNR